ncbi:MAG: hypothetical protein KDK70_23385 [Myxococcales bacterium]|nr:hypothetical protein [Myxococcales bacterium]
MNDDVAELAAELPDAELVLAFVSPLGTPLDGVQDALQDALIAHGYQIEVLVRISELLDQTRPAPGVERPEERQERLMEAGNELRRLYGGDYLALMAILTINASRAQDRKGAVVPHVIRSLKHPDEVARLRHVYGKGFFLIGVSAPRRLRRSTLVQRDFPRTQADRLLDKDAAEDEAIGQQTRDTFELADAYLRIDGGGADHARQKIQRLVDLLLSCPFHSPTREEHAMFMAYAAALRSSDLSRQVGAVVANRHGDVVASGANDAPAPHGGTYWPTGGAFTGDTDPRAGPDYLRGYDSNERERNEILARVLAALRPDEVAAARAMQPRERGALVGRFKKRLEGTGIFDLTEFGRAVHAEMAALLSCARSGVSPVEGTLYCTTFPCHNCAKHIVAAGITSVVYVEPYPKSKAKALHADSISLTDEDDDEPGERVRFRAFEGIGPRRFVDLFSLSLGSGRPVRRKQRNADGARIEWTRGEGSLPRLPLDPRSYLEREDAAVDFVRQRERNGDKLHAEECADGSDSSAAEDPDPRGGARGG